ncbi:CBS domain-containing protein [Paraburkholderia piptadeniae]|nr:CBS domain-containing protein [Paraburkholderia piptadeniae]
MRVRDLMTRFVVTVRSDDTIETIIESFEQAGVSSPRA